MWHVGKVENSLKVPGPLLLLFRIDSFLKILRKYFLGKSSCGGKNPASDWTFSKSGSYPAAPPPTPFLSLLYVKV